MKFCMAKSDIAVVDSNIWIAELYIDDKTHKKAKEVLSRILQKQTVVLSVFVVQEVCSVFMKMGHPNLAKVFYEFISEHTAIKIVGVDQEWLDAIAELLAEAKPRKALSYTDYSLICMAREFGAELVTFDKKLLAASKQLSS